MGLYLVYLINFAITLVAAVAVFAYWVANRKRIAAETVGRAEEQALRVMKDAERDAENRKKEALLEAKEKAHEMRTEAERIAREKNQQLTEAEQQLRSRESSLSERLSAAERKEKDLQTQRRPSRNVKEHVRRGRNTSSSSPRNSTSSSGCRG